MKYREMDQPLRGIVPPLVTPLAEADRLDVAGLERLLDHVLAGGVHGLFLLGTCGEGPSLSRAVQCEVIDRVCLQVDGRIPVLVSVTDTALAESLAQADYAAAAGAAAVVVAPPYYYPLEQAELARHIELLAAQSPLPVVLYNTPSLTKAAFELDTVERLLQVDHIVGLKDSSGDLDYFGRTCGLKQQRPDWSVMMGPEELLVDALALGADGGVSGGANVWPRLFVELYEAAVAGRNEIVRERAGQVLALGRIYDTAPLRVTSVIKGLKTALAVRGICDDLTAEPLQRSTPAARRHIEAVLADLGIAPIAAEQATREPR